jgi:hypothetical protein
MSGQLAKLFIRGRLINVTARNLTEEQKAEVNKLMSAAWEDKRLENARHEFCNALERTIGNEYKNREFAMNEIWITFWRTAVDVLYHTPLKSHEDYEERYEKWLNRKKKVTQDPVIRKKYFQTCMFNYLRQILKENKIPSYRHVHEISGSAETVAKDLIKFYLENQLSRPIEFTAEENFQTGTTVFSLNVNLVPVDLMKKIWDLRDEVSDCVQIVITDNSITILPKGEVKFLSKKVSQKIRIKSISLSGVDGDDESKNQNFQQFCEYKSRKKREIELDNMLVKDSIRELERRLPDQNRTKEVFDILVDPPQDFLDAYYPRRKKEVRPKETHIAKYLGISKNEVTKAVATIRQQALALDIS